MMVEEGRIVGSDFGQNLLDHWIFQNVIGQVRAYLQVSQIVQVSVDRT